MPTRKVSDDLVGLDAIREAHERIRPAIVRTPLYPSDVLTRELGSDVRLKLESLQRTGSFKFRGAYNYVVRLSDEVCSNGVITYSSGNHAQAAALAAQLHGTRAVVVMPTTSPQMKQEGAKRLGAEVVLEGTTSLERMAKAESLAEERGLVMVPPFDDPTIIAGAGTVVARDRRGLGCFRLGIGAHRWGWAVQWNRGSPAPTTARSTDLRSGADGRRLHEGRARGGRAGFARSQRVRCRRPYAGADREFDVQACP